MSNPNLRDYAPFDVLLIDEAQDMNLPMLDICLKQAAPKFIVGDPHQQIYAFNGAVNGMEQVKIVEMYKIIFFRRKLFLVQLTVSCCTKFTNQLGWGTVTAISLSVSKRIFVLSKDHI